MSKIDVMVTMVMITITIDDTIVNSNYSFCAITDNAGVILCMRPANERRRYIVTSLTLAEHTQNDPW